MLVPLYGFLQGDTLGLIVLVHAEQPVSAIADCLVEAAVVRVAPAGRPVVWARGRRLDAAQTIADAGLGALERVDVLWERDDGL